MLVERNIGRNEALEKIGEAAKAARAMGVAIEYAVTWADLMCPLTTPHGASEKLRRLDHFGKWQGWVYIRFRGANGRPYPTAELAATKGNVNR